MTVGKDNDALAARDVTRWGVMEARGNVGELAESIGSGPAFLFRTGFKTDFAARSSDKSMGKAGGRKGSEAY